MRKKLLFVLLPLLSVACTEATRDLYTPLEAPVEITASEKGTDAIATTPEVDILFVVDNSFSMEAEIQRASDDINRFVDVFTATNQLDFHIGVTTVWDSVRYSTENRQGEVDQFVRDADGSLAIDENGRNIRNFWSRGELLPVPVVRNGSLVREGGASRFLTASDNADGNLAEKMKQLLSVDVIAYEYQKDAEGEEVVCDPSGSNPDNLCSDEQLASIIPGTGRGPEVEEIFSPIQSALTEPRLLDGANRGFFRPNAFKVIVILSDADDSSVNISPSQLKLLLEQSNTRKPGNQFAVYSIMPTERSTCDVDYALMARNQEDGVRRLPEKVNQFMSDIGMNNDNHIFEICSSFGEKLAGMGEDVVEKTLALTEIRLERYPTVTQNTIRDGLTQPTALSVNAEELYPELDCNPELLAEVYNMLNEPLGSEITTTEVTGEDGEVTEAQTEVPTETETERLQTVDDFVRANQPEAPFDDLNYGPSWLRVCYDNQRVPVYDPSTGFGFQWDYDPARDRNSILIRGGDLLTPVAGGVFTVHATALDLRNNQNGQIYIIE